MSIYYPPKLGLYDPETNKPIYFTGTDTESGIYDITERGRYLIIRINISDRFGKTSPGLFLNGIFAGYGYSSDDGRIDSRTFIVGGSLRPHLQNKMMNLDSFMAAPLGGVPSFFWYGSDYVGDYFFSGAIDVGKLRSFGYGLSSDGLYNEIVIRSASIYRQVDPDDPDGPYSPTHDADYNVVVDGWVGEVADYNPFSGGTASNPIAAPILNSEDYYSPAIPGSEAYICTLRCKVSDGSITYSY